MLVQVAALRGVGRHRRDRGLVEAVSVLRQGDHSEGGGAGKGVAGGVPLPSGGLDAGNISRTWTCAGLSQVYRDTSQCEVYTDTELFQVLQPGQLRDRDTAGSVVLPGLVRRLLSGHMV